MSPADLARPPAAPPTFLGFDFGLRRIGVAVGQALTGTATPLEILPARDGQPQWARVQALIAQWAPDALVVGLPLNMDGSEQEMTARARRFGNQLAGRFQARVHFAEERLSTREARDRPAAGRLRAQGRHDAVAAQVILESWMRDGSDRTLGISRNPPRPRP